jgi:hypothetical protein
MPRRQIALVAVTLLLGAIVAADRLGYLDGGDGGGAAPADHGQARLVSEIEQLTGYAVAAPRMAAAYQEAALTYAQGVALARGLQMTPGDPQTFAKSVVQARIAAGPARDVGVSAGDAVDMGGGVHKVLLSVDFVTASDRHATRTIGELGSPEAGGAWTELAMTADAEAKTVKVSGRLALLVIETAE